MSFGFILKKILSALLMPLSLGLFVGLIGLWFLYRQSYKKAKIFLTISLLWISIVSYSPISEILVSPLEQTYSKLEIMPNNVKYILLLGGDVDNRGWEVLRLYNQKKDVKIITSGYAGMRTIPEAITTAKILEDIGIPKNKIIIHAKPKDTKEEAIKIRKTLKDEPFILVTSAYHMPRAMALFHKEGLSPIPAPTAYRVKYNSKLLSIPSGRNLKTTEIAWHEYLGLLWSKLRGQI